MADVEGPELVDVGAAAAEDLWAAPVVLLLDVVPNVLLLVALLVEGPEGMDDLYHLNWV